MCLSMQAFGFRMLARSDMWIVCVLVGGRFVIVDDTKFETASEHETECDGGDGTTTRACSVISNADAAVLYRCFAQVRL